MPLKASVGLSRKVGQENYGSLGANCQLEIELDNALVNDAEAFHEKIRRLYALANQAVVDQLARNGNGTSQPPASNGSPSPQNNGDDPAASNKQIKYLLDLARQEHKMDLNQTATFCQQTVGVSDVYQLTKSQASAVIDRLNGKTGNGQNGNGRRRTAYAANRS
jgi:hypothetical protein